MQMESPTLPRFGAPKKQDQEDKRLERLYDYTKFHIGIYLSAASGLAALIGSLANDKAGAFLAVLIGSPVLLFFGLVFMVLAGACGGVVATSVTESKTFEAFWNNSQAPSWSKRGLPGASWVAAEHAAFWLSLLFVLMSVLVNKKTLIWLMH